MNKNQAIKKKAEWLAFCLEIGFIEKSQIDKFSAIWDEHKDEYGNLRPESINFDLWLQTNYTESDFEGFWIDRDVWKDKSKPYFKLEDLKILFSQRPVP